PQYSPLPGIVEQTPVSYAGSDFERDTLAVIYGGATGTAPQDVPSWVTSATAPALRGAEVRMTATGNSPR
ncbi:hypothetical protein CH300_22150, partial [Rhodococcus sp. 15-1154-1]